MNKVLLNLLFLALNAVVAQSAVAAQVNYWFSGQVTRVMNPSNALPFQVTEGMPFTGRVLYDTALVAQTMVAHFPSGDVGNYYFDNPKGLSIIIQIAGHTITNAADPSGYSGNITVDDRAAYSDTLAVESGKRASIDGIPFLSPPYFSSSSLFFSDSSKTVFASADLPTALPDLVSFPDNHEIIWGAYRDDGRPTKLFSVEGVLNSITSSEQVMLNCRPLPANSVQLAWPASFAGFTLESTSDLVAGNWQSVTNPVVISAAGEHTVTVGSMDTTRFFRLKK